MLEDFTSFRKMITPTIIKVIYWIGIVAVVLASLGTLARGFATGGSAILIGLVGAALELVVGVIVVRVWCELLVVMFQINNTLSEIRELLERK